MNKLAPITIHRFKENGYSAVIFDPIYKVITGDENNATVMSLFCSFFDQIATEMGVSVIYCHHHSKGASGKYANAADRSSGSGVFARDPDAILDLRAERYFGEDTPLIPDEHGDYTRPVNFRRRYYRILEAAGIEQKGLHSIRHTFATNLVNGIKQPDGTIRSLTPRQVADLLGHSTSEITEIYYVKKDTARLSGITEGFEL